MLFVCGCACKLWVFCTDQAVLVVLQMLPAASPCATGPGTAASGHPARPRCLWEVGENGGESGSEMALVCHSSTHMSAMPVHVAGAQHPSSPLATSWSSRRTTPSGDSLPVGWDSGGLTPSGPSRPRQPHGARAVCACSCLPPPARVRLDTATGSKASQSGRPASSPLTLNVLVVEKRRVVPGCQHVHLVVLAVGQDQRAPQVGLLLPCLLHRLDAAHAAERWRPGRVVERGILAGADPCKRGRLRATPGCAQSSAAASSVCGARMLQQRAGVPPCAQWPSRKVGRVLIEEWPLPSHFQPLGARAAAPPARAGPAARMRCGASACRRECGGWRPR